MICPLRLRPLAKGEAVSHISKVSFAPNTIHQTCQARQYGGRHDHGVGRPSPKDVLAQRDFFFDVLNVSATRRDAKQYLAQFKQDAPKAATKPAKPAKRPAEPRPPVYARGVNLGSLYKPTVAIADSPTFRQQDEAAETSPVKTPSTSLHAALVSVRAVDAISDQDLDGLALTLSQLVRLGMRIVVTYDCTSDATDIQQQRLDIQRQGERLSRALSKHNSAGARYIESMLQANETQSRLSVLMPKMLFAPLERASIPIVPCMAYTESCRLTSVSRSDVVPALVRCLAGTEQQSDAGGPVLSLNLDRLIVVDGLGGIPSRQRQDRSHVFINMEQEYADISNELSATSSTAEDKQHLENLSMLKECLAILPPESSAVIISPEEAASSSRPTGDQGPASIRTRRQRNPLIHNLLTNRPVVSSSLPVARLSPSGSKTTSRSTLVKRGMPLTMIPDPRQEPWRPPADGISKIQLNNDKHIHFPRLLALVEDSFRRKLDVQGYLDRVRGTIAGVIVAGEYEGGAILTWESPPDTHHDPTRLVPYLDKFAVLQKAQGNAGVADIVFQAMVRSGFPKGVCWRSRAANPVNKWYFERSAGSWKLPGGYWTMFWTTPGEELVLDKQKWADYVALCQGVQPTWADGKTAE